ncbi:MAG TPA: hypothetical protein DCG19_03140 [Cryomorphaceae bacterium]|nr:hypothetical protein [Cryomorphaceae bacterium]
MWCAGSDRSILDHCPRGERIKHIGFGSLVLIPALLAFVSMAYALSTVEALSGSLLWCYLGGLIWALIIFSFDRLIVSTHIRKTSNREEVKNPAFYLRFLFALILGIVISHPLVLLYFDGSIEDRITADVTEYREEIKGRYEADIAVIQQRLNNMDSLYQHKEKLRNAQADIVAREIDGEVIRNAKGEILTTGFAGKGPSAENKIRHLQQLERELQQTRVNDSLQRLAMQDEMAGLKARSDSLMQNYAVSYDYLRRELALEDLKAEHGIVGLTQWFLMLLFVLVDILPVTFKTFAPYGLYDRMRQDDLNLLGALDPSKREEALQQAYNNASIIGKS